MTTLAGIDLLVIALYLAAVGLVDFRQTTTSEYFIADRRLPGWAVGFSIVGIVISSVSFVGISGGCLCTGLAAPRP